MTERGTFTPLHPTARKYVARTDREPLPAKLRDLIERLHEAEPIRDPREREGTQRRAQGKKFARAHH
jgi:hypothetical protein